MLTKLLTGFARYGGMGAYRCVVPQGTSGLDGLRVDPWVRIPPLPFLFQTGCAGGNC